MCLIPLLIFLTRSSSVLKEALLRSLDPALTKTVPVVLEILCSGSGITLSIVFLRFRFRDRFISSSLSSNFNKVLKKL